MFLIDLDGTAIGTATAWFYSNPRTPHGRLAWVQLSMFSRSGIAKPLLTTFFDALRAGPAGIYLLRPKDSSNQLYREFGFKEIKDITLSEVG